MDQTILGALKKKAEEEPQKAAIVCEEKTLSYQDLFEGVLRVACYYKCLGVQPRDRILVYANNSPAFAYGYFAAHACQAIAVPIEAQISSDRLNFIKKQTIPKVTVLRDDLSMLENQAKIHEPLDYKSIKLDHSFEADILFSTGTTGLPKGITLSHGNIWAAANHINQFIRNDSEDCEIVTVPLSHSFGLGRLRCNVLAGGALVLSNGLGLIGKFFKLLEKTQASAFSAVPAGIALILKYSGEKLSDYKDQLKYIEIGSSPMPIKQKKVLMHLLPETRICMHYGLTEASRSAFIEFHEHSNKLSSLGKPALGVEFRVQKTEDHSERGVFWVRGPHVTHNYWQNPSLTKQVLSDGWLNTGDIGYQDEDGFLYLEGRTSDMINMGGRNVAPSEIERPLMKHPDVEMAVCVGVEDPDELMGDVVCAFIKLRGGAFEIDKNNYISFLRKEIEPYKIPASFIAIDEIPTTSSGKIQRYLLKEEYAKFNTPLHTAS